jgi:hypothetical protein
LFDGHGTTIGGAEQPEDDLQLAGLAVPAVAEASQLAAAALEIARGEVIKHEAAILEMAAGEHRLDLRLRPAQEIKRTVELVLVHRRQAQHRAQRVRRGRLAELARRRQLGRRLDHPRHDQRQRQLGQSVGPARQEPIEAELAGHAEHGRDMTVRQGPLDQELVRRHGERCALERQAQRLDLGLGPARQVGERARPHLVAVAKALAQEDRRRRAAVRHARDVHEQP